MDEAIFGIQQEQPVIDESKRGAKFDPDGGIVRRNQGGFWTPGEEMAKSLESVMGFTSDPEGLDVVAAGSLARDTVGRCRAGRKYKWQSKPHGLSIF